MNVDHSAAVTAARTWALQMLAWDKCGMTQRFMSLQILRITGRPGEQRDLFTPVDVKQAAEQYESLGALVEEWKSRRAARPAGSDSLVWMIEQLENCLG